MNILIARALVLLFLAVTALHAQEPRLINYQGRVAVGGVNFDGSGQFKFAIVDAAGTTSYWSNDGTSTAGSEPGDLKEPLMPGKPSSFADGCKHTSSWYPGSHERNHFSCHGG